MSLNLEEKKAVVAEVSAQVAEKAFDLLDAPVIRVSGKNCPVPYSPVLENAMIPSHERIKESIFTIFKG